MADQVPTEVPYRGLRILSLDGGGVRGLSGLMILKYMMEAIDAQHPPKPCEVFDLIAGTSTGGLIAIMLGRLRMTVKEAIDAYLALSRNVFAPKHRLNFAANILNLAQAKGSCDTAALEKAIKGEIVKKLGAGHAEDLLLEEGAPAGCRIFVCAIRAGRRSLIKFRNYAADGADNIEPKIWEGARATSAATTFFDPITIGQYQQTFVDGGAEQNNPIQEAYDEAHAIWPDREIECLVSIGTGLSPLEAFGRNLKEVGKTLVHIATEADTTHSLFAGNHPQLPQYTDEAPIKRLYRFQVARGLDDVGMAEHAKIPEIADATQNYMEQAEEGGKKQLRHFKMLVGGPPNGDSFNFKISSVPLEVEKVRYIEKYAQALEFKSPKRLLPTGKPDYSSGTVLLPQRFLCTPDAYLIGDHEVVKSPAPVWAHVLARYGGLSNGGPDGRKTRVPVADIPWCPSSADSEGAFAIEVPVVEVWRIAASFNPFYASYTNEPNTATEIHVHDLWISVPGRIAGQPLVRMTRRSDTAFAPYSHAQIPAAAFADAMCGGVGLPPDPMCGFAVYKSSAPGWEVIRVGMAFAFALVPPQNRCYFREQWDWLAARAYHMVTVCDFLWDHADATDLDEHAVPIKVWWEETKAQLEMADGKVDRVYGTIGWRLSSLVPPAQSGLRAALRETGGNDAFVEVENAVELLMKCDKYAAGDRVYWDDDGKNKIVDDWWGLLGPDLARWVALDMTIRMILNMTEVLIFPDPFSALLKAGAGTCLIV